MNSENIIVIVAEKRAARDTQKHMRGYKGELDVSWLAWLVKGNDQHHHIRVVSDDDEITRARSPIWN